MSTPVLWHIELSHYSEKIRFALAYKNVEHERRTPLVGLHGPLAMLLTRSGHRRLPVMRVDGETIADSTAIIAALEERYPEPPLYPDDPDDRARALMLEDYFDETLAPALRLFVWYHQLREDGGFIDAVAPNGSGGRLRALKAMAPLAGPVVRADYGARAGRADDARRTLLEVADRIEAELQPSGYLVGDRFSVADLAGAALFTPLLCPPGREFPPRTQAQPVLDLREELEHRPAGQWVHDIYVRHRT